MNQTIAHNAAVQAAIVAITEVHDDLCAALIERETQVKAALVALVARHHMLMIGAPGAAKSRLVTELTRRIVPGNGGNLSLFQLLMTRFTEPAELFGPVSIPAMKQGRYEHVTTHMLPEADIAWLDEPFKASSAVLNTLLTILNERLFDNGGQRVGVPLLSAFGASNELPQGDDLSALWDRFALRLTVGYVSESGFAALLQSPTSTTPKATISIDDVRLLQEAATEVAIPDSIREALGTLRKGLAAEGIIASDRRWLWVCDLLRAHAVLERRAVVDDDDLPIIVHALWNTPDQLKEINGSVNRLGNPINARAVELGDQAESVYKAAMDAQSGKGDDTAKATALIEALRKITTITKGIEKAQQQAAAEGRNPARINRVLVQVRERHKALGELALGDIHG